MQFDTVFERTDAGVAEIHQKSNRLTQSERLVLIMTDGRTDIATMIEKLPSLSMPRVFRAISKLQDIGLMSQQLVAPVGSGNANDAIAQDVVERFLEQTDLDPATVLRPEADDFSPTTLPPGMSLKDPTAQARPDSDLERRLKALMGDTPKFARPEAPPQPPVRGAATASKVAAPVVDVAPEEVVRAARQQGPAAAAAVAFAGEAGSGRLKSTGEVKPGSDFDVALPRSSRKRRTEEAAPKKSTWPLYILMAIGAALVAFALLRILVK